MRTLILSDVHIGPDPDEGADYNIFAGERTLPDTLRAFCSPPTRVFFNGDAVDFLMNEDPLELDAARAAAQAQKIASSRGGAPVFAALGEILAAGGEVVIRLGNHDIELALGEVQEIIRAALKQPPEVAARLVFQRGEAPEILEVGGARILVTHGEHNDKWNYVPWDALPGPGGPEVGTEGFAYPPGSLLVKSLLNPLKRVFGLRFADLLKPDFRGAVLTGLAVDPDAVSVIWQRSTAELLRMLNRRETGPVTFGPEEDAILLSDVPELGLEALLLEAGLTPEEQQALEDKLAPEDPDGPMFFSEDEDDEGLWASMRRKLARAGLRRYASMHRKLAAEVGQGYFELEPDEAEWTEAERLAKKFDVDAVVIGHTHSARWRQQPLDDGRELAYLNTGTWIWMLRLPAPAPPGVSEFEAKLLDQEWAEYIEELRDNRSLDPAKAKAAKLETRFTGALLTEHPEGGAQLELLEWSDEGVPATLKGGRVRRHRG